SNTGYPFGPTATRDPAWTLEDPIFPGIDLSLRIYENFEDDDHGFFLESDQPNSRIFWDEPNGNVFFEADNHDPNDEMFVKYLDRTIDENSGSWILGARFMITEQGVWQYAMPLFIADPSRMEVRSAFNYNTIYFGYDSDTNTVRARYFDSTGTTRIYFTVGASLFTEYRARAIYDYNTRILLLQILDANDFVLIEGGYFIGTNPSDGFVFGKIGVATDGYSGAQQPSLCVGWTDDIKFYFKDYCSSPAFADLDNDGDFDMVIGTEDGYLYYYENIGTISKPIWDSHGTLMDNLGLAIDVGNNSKPTFVDLDSDLDYDLVIGKADGLLAYYRNDGDMYSPIWVRDDTLFTGIGVAGNSAPAFADIHNDDGLVDMVIGASDGMIYYYVNIGSPTLPVWQYRGTIGSDVGDNSSPTFVDIDNDGDFDLVVGEESGNLNYFRNVGTAANPVFVEISGGIYNSDWVGANDPVIFDGIDVGFRSSPVFVDLDGDWDMDLIIGEKFGTLRYYDSSIYIPEESPVTFRAFFTDPGWLDIHSAIWDFDDGSGTEPGFVIEENNPPDATGTVEVTHFYHDFYDGGFEDYHVYTVKLTLTDDDGAVTIVSIKIKVLNTV
ncbi:MAG: VCBS repeat-containing protein, partial [Methanomassiliicoccales archaeon]